jgi:hypothetical protein
MKMCKAEKMQKNILSPVLFMTFALSLPDDPYKIVKNGLQLTFYMPRRSVGSQVGRKRESFAGP